MSEYLCVIYFIHFWGLLKAKCNMPSHANSIMAGSQRFVICLNAQGHRGAQCSAPDYNGKYSPILLPDLRKIGILITMTIL